MIITKIYSDQGKSEGARNFCIIRSEKLKRNEKSSLSILGVVVYAFGLSSSREVFNGNPGAGLQAEIGFETDAR